jgi:hypothetical protein
MKLREPMKLHKEPEIWGTRHLLEGERDWDLAFQDRGRRTLQKP